MNKLNQMLIATPSEFAVIFGELTNDAAAKARTDTTGGPPGAVAVAMPVSARKDGFRDARKSHRVEFFSLEASIGTLGSRREDAS